MPSRGRGGSIPQECVFTKGNIARCERLVLAQDPVAGTAIRGQGRAGQGGAGQGGAMVSARCTYFPNGDMTHMTYYFRRAEVGLLGDLRSYNINTLRGLLHNLGGPPLGDIDHPM
jgi:hypothetical protein